MEDTFEEKNYNPLLPYFVDDFEDKYRVRNVLAMAPCLLDEPEQVDMGTYWDVNN